MRDVLKLLSRAAVGGYMVVHGSQKLLGAFDGPGLDKAGATFEKMGLQPGRQMALRSDVVQVVATGGLARRSFATE